MLYTFYHSLGFFMLFFHWLYFWCVQFYCHNCIYAWTNTNSSISVVYCKYVQQANLRWILSFVLCAESRLSQKKSGWIFSASWCIIDLASMRFKATSKWFKEKHHELFLTLHLFQDKRNVFSVLKKICLMLLLIDKKQMTFWSINKYSNNSNEYKS